MKILTAFFLILFSLFSKGQSCCKPTNTGGFELPPEIFRGIGRISSICTTDNDSCRFFIEQGWALAHQYNYSSAGRSFNRAIQLDSNCMMGYLGLHHCALYSDLDDLAFELYSICYDKWGSKLYQENDSLEFFFVSDTLFTTSEYVLYFADMLPHYEKKKNLINTLDFAVTQWENWPTDLNTFLIVSKIIPSDFEKEDEYGLREVFGSSTALLEENLYGNENSPFLIHYYMHNIEDTLPENLLKYAQILPGLTPGSAHLVHMPAHVYFKLGIYDSAIYWLDESIKVDTAYNHKYPEYAKYNWNYNHNLDYKSRVLLEMGYPDSARKLYESIIYNPTAEATSMEFQQMVVKTDELFVHWRLRDWQELEEKCKTQNGLYETEGYNYWFQTVQQYARMMHMIEHNDFENWKNEEKRWKTLKKKSRKDKNYNYWDLMHLMNHELKGIYAARTGDHFEVEFRAKEMEYWTDLTDLEFGDPSQTPCNVHESIAHLFYQGQQWQKAIDHFSYALKKQPNSGFIELYLAKSYFHLGNKTQAQLYLDRFYAHWKEHKSNKRFFEMARILEADLKK